MHRRRRARAALVLVLCTLTWPGMAAPPVQGAMSNMEGRVVEFLRSLSADLLAQSPVHRKSITLGARN